MPNSIITNVSKLIYNILLLFCTGFNSCQSPNEVNHQMSVIPSDSSSVAQYFKVHQPIDSNLFVLTCKWGLDTSSPKYMLFYHADTASFDDFYPIYLNIYQYDTQGKIQKLQCDYVFEGVGVYYWNSGFIDYYIMDLDSNGTTEFIFESGGIWRCSVELENDSGEVYTTNASCDLGVFDILYDSTQINSEISIEQIMTLQELEDLPDNYHMLKSEVTRRRSSSEDCDGLPLLSFQKE